MPRFWATEVVPGHKVAGLEKWKADIVFFRSCSVTQQDMRSAVLATGRRLAQQQPRHSRATADRLGQERASGAARL
jgi:hypothetical protein